MRSQTNWTVKPGSLDVLHTNLIFESDNDYGFPIVGMQKIKIPDSLIPFNKVKSKHEVAMVHTFIEDYQLERVWKRPYNYIQNLLNDVFISPDFSLYTDMPVALQVFNTYKNRYIGRFMQEYGITVIPSVSWSDKRSFIFCFEGIMVDSMVAISSIGINKGNSHLFMNGVEMLLKKINPKTLICYGSNRKDELNSIHKNVLYLKTFTEEMRDRIFARKVKG